MFIGELRFLCSERPLIVAGMKVGMTSNELAATYPRVKVMLLPFF